MRELARWLAVSMLVIGLAASVALASGQARVSGTVVDTTGKPIGGATITVTCPEAPTFKKVLEAEQNGGFRLLLLDATKSYNFHVQAAGYAPYDHVIKVGIGTMDNEFTFTLQSDREATAAQQQAILEQPGYKQLEDGLELMRAGQLDAARVKFSEAVAAVPDLAAAWGGLADIDYRAGNHASAIQNAKSCLDHDAQNTKCLAIAANSSKELGDVEAHHAYMMRYQELNPDDPTTLFNQAAEYLNALDDERARPLLEQCLAVDPKFPECLFEYAMVLLRSGDMEGAKAHLERYLEAAPEGSNAAAARETIKYL
jgi:Tfp pilus assembly protein PilF